MRTGLFLYLAQYRIFWRMRAAFSRICFSISSRLFRIRYGVLEEGANTRFLFDFLRITLPQLVFAILAAIGLQIIDPYISDLPPFVYWKIPENGDYVTLLGTVSGVGGVFIGLYYAGVTTVGSVVYSRVPNNIRDLLARERVGNVYMRYLAFVTFIALCLIGFRVFGLSRIHLAVPVVTVLSGIGIIAFAKLGQRAFYLFDPTRLSYPLFDDLRHWLRRASVGGYRWNDPSFQNHAHKQAQAALDALETLADISIREQHLNGRPFAELSRSVIGFLMIYQGKKNRIPSDSRWYAQRYIHRDWYRTEDTAVHIAHQTGTSLQPEVITNKNWIEERLFPIVLRCVTVNLNAQRFDLVVQLHTYVDAYVKSLASGGDLLRALEAVEQLSRAVFEGIAKPADKYVLEGEVLEHLGIAEHLATMLITILLSYSESVHRLDKEWIYIRLSHIRWRHSIDIYNQEFESYLLPRLEWLQPRLQFENAVEDHIVSPLWYQTTLVAQVEAEKFAENIEKLLFASVKLYQCWFDLFDKAKHPWLQAAVLSREWEYWHKTKYHLTRFEEFWNNLKEKRCIEGLPWPQLDANKWVEQVRNQQVDILKRMAEQSIVLSISSRPIDFPDYGGQFLHTAGEAAFDALTTGDLGLTKAIFPSYFFGCLKKFDDLRPKTGSTDWRTQQEFRVAAAPLLDLMELSGYACLFSELHSKPELWLTITSIWDKYLAQSQTPPPATLLIAAIELTEAQFAIPHRGVLRTGWKQRINHVLRDLPRKEVYRGAHTPTSDTVVLHKSPLVRLFAKQRFGGFHDGIDIFITLYLRKRPGTCDPQSSRARRGRDLEKYLVREEKFYEQYATKLKEGMNGEKNATST